MWGPSCCGSCWGSPEHPPPASSSRHGARGAWTGRIHPRGISALWDGWNSTKLRVWGGAHVAGALYSHLDKGVSTAQEKTAGFLLRKWHWKLGMKEKEGEQGWAVDCTCRPGGFHVFLSSSKPTLWSWAELPGGHLQPGHPTAEFLWLKQHKNTQSVRL